MVLLFAAVPARPQELPSSFSELLPDPAEDAAGAVEAETERPREMTIEEARRSVAEGQQRQRDEYDEWLRSGADAVVPPEEQIIDELRSADSELPPMPDDLDGEITLEREKQEGL
jgi:predicted transcriptional regulator